MIPQQLTDVCPHAAAFYEPLLTTFAQFEINTPARQAMFLAQVAHESAGFTRLAEDLDYSAPRLQAVFPHLFPDAATAQRYARKPREIANRVYGGRLGNGPEDSGDGWMFRGGGLIQLTGRANYAEYSHAAYGNADTVLRNPDLLREPLDATRSAGWFWHSRGCNALADKDQFTVVTHVINGGLTGFAERSALWKTFKISLGVSQ
jgi:putative chitinase